MTRPEVRDRETGALARAYLRMAAALERQQEADARERIALSPDLAAYSGWLLDWPAEPGRWAWLATAPEADLIDWCERVKWYHLEDRERYPDNGSTK